MIVKFVVLLINVVFKNFFNGWIKLIVRLFFVKIVNLLIVVVWIIKNLNLFFLIKFDSVKVFVLIKLVNNVKC